MKRCPPPTPKINTYLYRLPATSPPETKQLELLFLRVPRPTGRPHPKGFCSQRFGNCCPYSPSCRIFTTIHTHAHPMLMVVSFLPLVNLTSVRDFRKSSKPPLSFLQHPLLPLLVSSLCKSEEGRQEGRREGQKEPPPATDPLGWPGIPSSGSRVSVTLSVVRG